MRTNDFFQIRIALAIIGFGILTSCAAPKETRTNPAVSRSGPSIADLIDHDVDTLRRTRGLSATRRHPGLDGLAAHHCEYLRKYRGTSRVQGKNVSHNGFKGRAFTAMQAHGMSNYSENVAWTTGYPSHDAIAQTIVKMWQNSPKHRDAMLGDDWTHTGVATVMDSDGSVFATQIFTTARGFQTYTP